MDNNYNNDKKTKHKHNHPACRMVILRSGRTLPLTMSPIHSCIPNDNTKFTIGCTHTILNPFVFPQTQQQHPDSHSHSTNPFQPHNHHNKRRGTKKGKPPSKGRIHHPSKQQQQAPRTNYALHTNNNNNNTPTTINKNQGPCWIALDDEDLIHGPANERYRSLFEQDHVVPVQSSVGLTLANARQALMLLRRQQQQQQRRQQHDPLDLHTTTSTSNPHQP